ncbi:MAG TPA: DUF1704 domain-containing protein [Intrasporangiaceae bacterium]|nr:DUF1704 domain-containing protein [Intrasporangiaceae bacterium]
MSTPDPPGAEPAFSPGDLAVDHALARLSGGVRFLLDVTPVDVDEVRDAYLSGEIAEPEFTYRDLETDPDVLAAELAQIDPATVENTTLGALLRAKHREMELQLEMLRARGTPDFLQMSVELYGAVSPALYEKAGALLLTVDPPAAGEGRLDAEEFRDLAEQELDHYRELDPDIGLHVEIRDDVSGVLCEGTTLLISAHSSIDSRRAFALLQHEIGTHLITQVNGSRQPVTVLGTGLAGYDETQEGLAVLAEVAVGGLTPARLRQLAARVVVVHDLLAGAGFTECHERLVEAGLPSGGAFTTVMRVFRSGGLTKDAIYLRGLVDLLAHLAGGGALQPFYLGKFALTDLPLIEDLAESGLIHAPHVLPRFLDLPGTTQRLAEAAAADDLTQLTRGEAA